MIAISSFRPHNLSEEYRVNQIRAKESWEKVFSKIVYLGNYEKELDSEKTLFLGYSGWPTIKDIAGVAARQTGLVALVNADIVLTPAIHDVERKMIYTGIQVAVSRRFQFEPDKPYPFPSARIVDKGLDIFITHPNVWSNVHQQIPADLRIGNIQFDTYLTGFFLVNYGNAFRDFSRFQCVFHPKHEGREMPHNPPEPLKDRYSLAAKLPQTM